MADEEEQEQSPIEEANKRADALNLEGEDREDWIEAKMRRAGFKKGPGEWISVDEDDGEDKEDDNEPMTRGDWRRMRQEQKKKSVAPPPKKKAESDETRKPAKRDPWW